MAITKTVTAHNIPAVRINDDQSIMIVLTVTYDNATTETLELQALRLVK